MNLMLFGSPLTTVAMDSMECNCKLGGFSAMVVSFRFDLTDISKVVMVAVVVFNVAVVPHLEPLQF